MQNVFTKSVNKIVLSFNDDKIQQPFKEENIIRMTSVVKYARKNCYILLLP